MDAVAASTGQSATVRSPWWSRRWFVLLIVLATMVPLLYPPIPPLVDLPGHIGRYRVELDLARSPSLQHYYAFHWVAVGNLGVDVLLLILVPILGLEPSVKLIVLLIPPLAAIGMLWVAREVHGRIPPTALFALPFIYSFPLMFGFVNFVLSVALAFLALGLWLRLGRTGKTRLREWLLIPISLIVYFCHTYGWGLLGLMCFSAEAVRLRDCGRTWSGAAFEAALHVSVMALPFALMLASPDNHQVTAASGWFDWSAKWIGVMGVLRDRWGPFDISTVEFAAVVFLFAIISPRLRLSRELGLLAAVLALSFLLLPRFIFDSAYADVRLLPFLFSAALLAIGLRDPADTRLGRSLALLAVAFFVIRTGATTASLAMAADDQRAKLAALQHVPPGARVASFYGLPYAEPWNLQRDSHLGGLVIARREGFSNDQWITPWLSMLELRYRGAGEFSSDPSEIVRPNGTHDGVYRTIDEALIGVPRNGFDYIWLISPPPFDPRLVNGLQLVWRGPDTMLYRIGSGAAHYGRSKGDMIGPAANVAPTLPRRSRL